MISKLFYQDFTGNVFMISNESSSAPLMSWPNNREAIYNESCQLYSRPLKMKLPRSLYGFCHWFLQKPSYGFGKILSTTILEINQWWTLEFNEVLVMSPSRKDRYFNVNVLRISLSMPKICRNIFSKKKNISSWTTVAVPLVLGSDKNIGQWYKHNCIVEKKSGKFVLYANISK